LEFSVPYWFPVPSQQITMFLAMLDQPPRVTRRIVRVSLPPLDSGAANPIGIAQTIKQ
jgi:hypothetical protein